MTDRIEDREFRFDVTCDLDLVWDALTTPEGLSSWYVTAAEVDPVPGGKLKADWGTGPAGMGSFEAVDPRRRLRLVYGDEGGPGAEEWLLDHENGVTRVRLIHSLPVEEGSTWDDTYPGIVRGWAVFMGTLRFIAERVGRLGRTTEVRLGDIAHGAWPRILSALGLDKTPEAGAEIDVAGRSADVLVATDGYSLLLGLDDEATLLIDVEGAKLYTVAASYGELRSELLDQLIDVADLVCAAAG